jgi:hypothetical protein
MSRKARYRIGGLCKCRAPRPVAGGPYGIGFCGSCGRLLRGVLRSGSPAVDLGPTEAPEARETGGDSRG